MGAYKYRGTGTTMTEQQVQDHLAKVRAGIRDGKAAPTSALATSSHARDADARPPRIIPGEIVQPQPAPPVRAVPELKGAVKVGGFPAQAKYPFAEIAADGGVWKLDPAAFTWRGKPTKPQSIRTAASKWAIERGMRAKVQIDGGEVYVQFRKDGA